MGALESIMSEAAKRFAAAIASEEHLYYLTVPTINPLDLAITNLDNHMALA